MFVRRSVRLNPAYNPKSSIKKEDGNSEEYFVSENQNQFKQKQLKESVEEVAEKVKSETEIDVEMIEEKPGKSVSATVKALNKIDNEMSEKIKGRKNGKIPVALKKRHFNRRLSKLLTPKSALILLHELKPQCIYKIQEQPGCIPPSFIAQVFHNDEILGIGQGLSKSHAKNSAAENAIKTIVSKAMSNQSTKSDSDIIETKDEEMEDTPENLPWAGLASFAIYKMFSEWQTQGTDLLTRPVTKPKPKPVSTPDVPAKKNLPSNAHELHPAVVLNMVCPGITAVEIEREDGPKCRVKMGYSIGGKMYTGVGGNKKDAKKEAAKAVLEGFYGLTYPQ